MKNYSVDEVSKKLNISKYTLRYYDKMNLISPKRGDNNYRYYSKENIIDLKYIGVMKYAGFTLEEMKEILNNKNNVEPSPECRNSTLNLLENKHRETLIKIEKFTKILELIEVSTKALKGKEFQDFKTMDDLVLDIYNCNESTTYMEETSNE